MQITFGQSNPDLEEHERLLFSKRVLSELRDLDQVEHAERTEKEASEFGEKGFSTLVGFLTAEVTLPNLKAFINWMGDRFSDQPMKVKVKVGEQEVEFEARSQLELAQLEEVANSLLAKMSAGGA
ncbi:hypothetical protein AM1_1545 [Acaryochloris marina MBIC11017]|uniref:Uncharacterized protein n=2 Tax=Acaryochloris marina TaxID=155978 RepID=B0C935_ACAM1|nr:hypothetical protein AM1_1545 [Acaryochloris marina MBIC11017]